MDKLEYFSYDMKFQLAYKDKKGDAFQDFFSEIMEKCHPGDFQRSRPWGPDGDKKNDGYLWSERTLFQVYAPNEMRADDAIAKIDKDFHGALEYWRGDFDKWIFVHNAKDGLGPRIQKKLIELDTCYSPIIVRAWGYEELWQKVLSLDEPGRISLLGVVPSNRDMLNVRYETVQDVLNNIARQKAPLLQDIRPVPPDKLKFNRLSEEVQALLTAGMQKADLVGNFFKNHTNPQYGDEIAIAFNKKYKECKMLTMDPDTTFLKLQIFTGGQEQGTPTYQAAVLAVLAYLFEQCEIFERSSEEATL